MITDEEFRRISTYMKQNYGIDLTQKKVIVNGRLQKHMKTGGWKTVNEFMDAVERDRSGVEEKMLVNLLTTRILCGSLSILIILKVRCFPG